MTKDEQDSLEIKAELQKYARGSAIPSLGDTLQKCHIVVIRSVLGAFGFRYFGDKKGGNVTTIHNFTQGITATDEDYRKYLAYSEPYSEEKHRSPYDRVQKKIRDPIIKSSAPIISGYTGRELPHDGQAQLEHIVPVGEIESMPANFLFMDLPDRVNLAYSKENLTMLESSINQSKSNIPLQEWMLKTKNGFTQTNAERFGIDVKAATVLDVQARRMIRNEQRKAAFRKQGPELLQTGLHQGVALGTREVVALILIEFYDEGIDCVRKIMLRYQQKELTFSNAITEIKASLTRVKDNLLERYRELLAAFGTGFVSGFLSNLLVFAINTLLTTAKHAVMIIRETVYALIRVTNILCSDRYPNHQAKVDAAADVLISSLSIVLTCLLGEAIQKYIAAVPYSEEISYALSAILVGTSSILICYYFQSMQAEIAAATAAVAHAALTTTQVAATVRQLDERGKKRIEELDKSTDRLKSLKF